MTERNRWAHVGLLWGVALLTSCVSTSVTARPETAPPPAAAASAVSFWEALDAFDLERARQIAADRAEQDLAFAIDAALSGDVDEAIAASRRSWQAMRDSASRQRARDWLEGFLLSQSRWKEILDVYMQDPTPIHPAKDLRPFASVYEAVAREQYQFAYGEDTIPIAVSAAGIPVADVEINGHRKKFVIDTGATITTVSTDVARESGMMVGRDLGQAGTATSRTVAIRGAVIDHLRLGGLVIRHHPAGVIESSALRFRLMGLVTIFKVDGVLGWNAIRQMTLRINYRDKTTIISAPQKHPPAATRNLLNLVEPIVCLTDEHGHRLFFKLDTGASFSSLDERTLSKIDHTTARRKSMVFYSAGGSERYKSAVIPRLALRVSGHALEFRNVMTHPESKGAMLRRDGRLGSDIARGGSMTIDALNGRFELERKK